MTPNGDVGVSSVAEPRVAKLWTVGATPPVKGMSDAPFPGFQN